MYSLDKTNKSGLIQYDFNNHRVARLRWAARVKNMLSITPMKTSKRRSVK